MGRKKSPRKKSSDMEMKMGENDDSKFVIEELQTLANAGFTIVDLARTHFPISIKEVNAV